MWCWLRSANGATFGAVSVCLVQELLGHATCGRALSDQEAVAAGLTGRSTGAAWVGLGSGLGGLCLPQCCRAGGVER